MPFVPRRHGGGEQEISAAERATGVARKEGLSRNPPQGQDLVPSSPQKTSPHTSAAGPQQPGPEEQQEVRKLAARDREVRTHEAAHAAVGGQYAGSPSYSFETGPDGRRYAVGGEVPFDMSPVPGDSIATAQKAETIRRAALAPASPSSQDRMVAAKASRLAAKARLEGVHAGASAEEKKSPSPEATLEAAPAGQDPLARAIEVYKSNGSLPKPTTGSTLSRSA